MKLDKMIKAGIFYDKLSIIEALASERGGFL